MNNFQVAEVIAQLDVFEHDLLGMVQRVREYRHTLFDALDTEDE